MTQPSNRSPSDSVSRLLQAARRPSSDTTIPTLHERRLEGIEAAQRLRDRPKPH